MTSLDSIYVIYEEFKRAYAPITRELNRKLLSGNDPFVSRGVMFPPRDGKPFTSLEAEVGFLNHDCAILTAFRATRTYEENCRENESLKADMRLRGLNFLSVMGCFRESREAEASMEESFFVYENNDHRVKDFFCHIYQLSEKYGQDSFLFKAVGLNRTAFLVSTNEDSRSDDGNVKLAGHLYLNLPPVGPYTELDGGRITFLIDPPDESAADIDNNI